MSLRVPADLLFRRGIKGPCWVYVVCEFSGDQRNQTHSKVGIARDIRARISGMQTGNYRKLQVVAAFQFASRSVARDIELNVHCSLRDHLATGEWFSVPPGRAIATISAYCLETHIQPVAEIGACI